MKLRWEHKTLDRCAPSEVLAFAKLRTDVFFLEQHITEEEIDRFDFELHTQHLWCVDGAQVVGYVRVVQHNPAKPEDRGVATSIGRLVVDVRYRGSGIARGLMTRALAHIGHAPVVIHAQSYIHTFYASLGFEPFGDVFDEAGIEHIRMLRPAGEVQ
ncbi:MAG: GNAT family N-acetyltransferase [Pontimonas sp.]